MAERRQVARQEPITVEVWDGSTFEAHPLPWLDRNDLGTEILKQYRESFNEALSAWTNPEGVAQIDLVLNDKLKDPIAILQIAYPDSDPELFKKLHWPEIQDLIYASCDVNGHEGLKPLIDPNSPTPEKNGGKTSPGEVAEALAGIQKMRSTPDSDSPDSPEMMSSDSPTMKSTPSSESGIPSDGTKDTGESP